MTMLGHQQQPRLRGFASMDAAKQREIASRGGRAAHAQGTAHKFSPEEARLAGRKGGERVSGNREYMARIGRRGGEARHARRIARASSSTGSMRPRGAADAASFSDERGGTRDGDRAAEPRSADAS